MADVRSMLRASRQARRINHPHASYTSDGRLLCNLCEALVKTEASWQGHLHSTQHTLQLSRAQDTAAARDANGNGGGKKRKASTLEACIPQERKKPRPAAAASVGNEGAGARTEDALVASAALVNTEDNPGAAVPKDEPAHSAELEALDRELAEMEASMRAGNLAQAAPTISAPAMTAEEIAAQARENQSAQRGQRDAELDAEREDAARLLDDEFEKMEGLEERVRRLRDRREALRNSNLTRSTKPGGLDDITGHKDAAGQLQPERAVLDDACDDAHDDDEEDDYDNWNFGGP